MSCENGDFIDRDAEVEGRRITESDGEAAADAFELEDPDVLDVTYPSATEAHAQSAAVATSEDAEADQDFVDEISEWDQE